MAFLVYRPQDNDVIGPYESTEDCLNDPGRPGNRVFEVADFDPTADFASAFKLSDDGNSLVRRFPGKTLEEQAELIAQEKATIHFDICKANKKMLIGDNCSERLKEMKWKKDKATDIDLINGNTNAMTAYYAEREALRVANNNHVAALEALTTQEEVDAFDPKAF